MMPAVVGTELLKPAFLQILLVRLDAFVKRADSESSLNRTPLTGTRHSYPACLDEAMRILSTVAIPPALQAWTQNFWNETGNTCMQDGGTSERRAITPARRQLGVGPFVISAEALLILGCDTYSSATT